MRDMVVTRECMALRDIVVKKEGWCDPWGHAADGIKVMVCWLGDINGVALGCLPCGAYKCW